MSHIGAPGSDVGISTLNSSEIHILAKAQYSQCACCLGPRTYFHVLENAVETNTPYYCWPCVPGICGMDFDVIWKLYYDRGIWDRRDCCHESGCISGPPSFFSHNPKHVCLCMDCPECYNDCTAGHCAGCCGDKLRYTPYETSCCGLCSTRANACTNCCGLHGVKTGEPVIYYNMASCLLAGSGEQLAAAINDGRAAWSARTNKP